MTEKLEATLRALKDTAPAIFEQVAKGWRIGREVLEKTEKIPLALTGPKPATKKSQFPLAGPEYIRLLVRRDGVNVHLMLTEEQFQVAAERATKNPEDVS